MRHSASSETQGEGEKAAMRQRLSINACLQEG